MARPSLPFLLLFSLLPGMTATAKQYSAAAQRFAYDRKAALHIVQKGKQVRAGVTVRDITYAGAEGPVPAYLVVPGGHGPFAAILWGHWMMKGSPYMNRREFLDEATILARSGVVSLLIDAPMIRPGHLPRDEPLDTRQDVIDLRRGIDLLLARKDVDPARIAYVGHSFHADAGAILAGVDHRLKALVLMAGTFDYFQLLVSGAPESLETRKKVPLETLRRVFETYSWANPCQFVRHAAPAAVFLQDGNHDQFMTIADIEHYDQCVSNPKKRKIYDAGHALNPQATKDRDEWLAGQLGLKPLDWAAIDRLPQLR